MKLIDLTGQTFGKLTVLKRAENRDKRVFWLCKCECGNIKEVSAYNLKSGKIKSCGCLKNNRNFKHGLSKSYLYKTWQKMKDRCCNKNNKDYKYCGAVGITVCEEWKKDFQNFYDWAMSNGYKQDLFIDRIDKSKNYESNNCRFVTRYEQSRNKSSNKYITFNGKTKTVMDWSLSLGLGVDTVARRLRDGWSVERALTEPHNGTKSSNAKSLAQMKRYLTNNYVSCRINSKEVSKMKQPKKSGRLLADVGEDRKQLLYLKLLQKNKTFRDWLIEQIDKFLERK